MNGRRKCCQKGLKNDGGCDLGKRRRHLARSSRSSPLRVRWAGKLSYTPLANGTRRNDSAFSSSRNGIPVVNARLNLGQPQPQPQQQQQHHRCPLKQSELQMVDDDGCLDQNPMNVPQWKKFPYRKDDTFFDWSRSPSPAREQQFSSSSTVSHHHDNNLGVYGGKHWDGAKRSEKWLCCFTLHMSYL